MSEHGDTPTDLLAHLQRLLEASARYQRYEDPVGLDEAVDAWERILRQPAFAGLEPKLRLAVLGQAGVDYLGRHERRGQMRDLDDACISLTRL